MMTQSMLMMMPNNDLSIVQTFTFFSGTEKSVSSSSLLSSDLNSSQISDLSLSLSFCQCGRVLYLTFAPTHIGLYVPLGLCKARFGSNT